MIVLKPFQEAAVSKMKDNFLMLWKSETRGANLILKAPTGSGKTTMMAQFLRDLTGEPRFTNADVAFLWITKGSLAQQSKDKLLEYYDGVSENKLLDINDLRDGVLPRNAVFFVNWEKLVSRSAENRRLRVDGDTTISFDTYIRNTHNKGREVILIIDEEHLAANTVLASDLIQNVIRPRIIIGVSATPQNSGAMTVEVPHEDVVESGLIKEKIIFQTEEDLRKFTGAETNQDEILLELAWQKRLELLQFYKDIGENINPLVLIQLPNDDQASVETGTSKRDIVVAFLKNKGVTDEEIAVWLDKDKTLNLSTVRENNSSVAFLLFKQAAATGWDCPRASVLVMFREIKNATFAIQTVGRILRMPLARHFTEPALNLGYLYTNYKRNEIVATYDKNGIGENRPTIYESKRKAHIKPLVLESTNSVRSDYNDLGDSFQQVFKHIANDFFDIQDSFDTRERIAQIEAKGLNLTPEITSDIITGVEIDDYDNFVTELKAEGSTQAQKISLHDVERLYNLYCFKIINEQTDTRMKYAPTRSWGPLKSALNVWFSNNTQLDRANYYKVIINDFLAAEKGGHSILLEIIRKALWNYRPIRVNEIVQKAEQNRERGIVSIEVPAASDRFTDLCEELDVKRNVYDRFYIGKDYKGRKNEEAFLRFIDNNEEVEWWHKNGDHGSLYFAVPYMDGEIEQLFYPDWFIKTRGKTWVVDTKSGETANSAGSRAEGLRAWLEEREGFDGGIVIPGELGTWKIFVGSEYRTDDSEQWKPFTP
ncbi:MAG TPA: DEAD/DEAH box helicase family protein [Candidatus Saccharimonadales bacterium]|nr:DEAD/DEAH box helicase family protein [Candidatus Saccharimonadales bacterium]